MESMTGYGKAAQEAGGVRVTAEVRGVNHKGLDIHLRLPQSLWGREQACRDAVRARSARGRVDVGVTLELLTEEAVEVRLSEGVLRSLGGITATLVEEKKLERGLTFSDVLAIPEALSVRLSAARQAEAEGCLDRAVASALDLFSEARKGEGMRLRAQFEEGRASLERFLGVAESLEPAQVQEVRSRLESQLAALKGQIDPQRLEQEALLLAGKADVREEVVRLRAHTKELGATLAKNAGGEGKRLDHLFQEMQREVSTLLAKSATLDLTRCGMEMRLLVEQLREQVQNVA
jgi:uncharacterized protein (TIGR00255 family)